MKRKKKPDRCITRKVRISVGGRVKLTVRSRLTLPQTLRQLGGDPVCQEGRLLTGMPLSISRTVHGNVRVEAIYYCNPRPEPIGHFTLDTIGAVVNARAGGVL